MKRLPVILVLVLLLAGGGGGAWWYMNRDAEAAGVEGPAEAGRLPSFVKIDPIVLPLIQQNEVTRFVTVVMVREHGPDSPLVRQRVKLVSERILGPGTVDAVLVQGVSKQRPGSG